MKYFFLFFFGIFLSNSYAQNNTDVYIFDIEIHEDGVFISNILNISPNDGYDNQPSFIDKNTLVYSSTNNGKTDIAEYNIKKDKKTWINSSEYNEYSPILAPFKNTISAVRVLKSGDEHLYQFNIKNGDEAVLIDNLKIGYHAWINEETVLLAILENNSLSLNIANITTKTNKTVVKNIGRSLSKIPNSNLFSYISKESKTWEIRSYNPATNTSKLIIKTLEGSEDLCWTSHGYIIMAKGNELHVFNPKKDEDWKLLGVLSDERMTNITRLNINSDASKLAIVVESE